MGDKSKGGSVIIHSRSRLSVRKTCACREIAKQHERWHISILRNIPKFKLKHPSVRCSAFLSLSPSRHPLKVASSNSTHRVTHLYSRDTRKNVSDYSQSKSHHPSRPCQPPGVVPSLTAAVALPASQAQKRISPSLRSFPDPSQTRMR